MKITKELKALSGAELRSRLDEFKKELLKLNVQAAGGASTGSAGRLKQSKKNIARILTVLKEKEGQSA